MASDVGRRVDEMRWVLQRTYLHQRRRTKSCFSASTEGQRTVRSILIDPAYSVSEGDVAVCPALHGRSLTSVRWDTGEDNFQIRQRQLWIYLEDDTTRMSQLYGLLQCDGGFQVVFWIRTLWYISELLRFSYDCCIILWNVLTTNECRLIKLNT